MINKTNLRRYCKAYDKKEFALRKVEMLGYIDGTSSFASNYSAPHSVQDYIKMVYLPFFLDSNPWQTIDWLSDEEADFLAQKIIEKVSKQ